MDSSLNGQQGILPFRTVQPSQGSALFNPGSGTGPGMTQNNVSPFSINPYAANNQPFQASLFSPGSAGGSVYDPNSYLNMLAQQGMNYQAPAQQLGQTQGQQQNDYNSALQQQQQAWQSMVQGQIAMQQMFGSQNISPFNSLYTNPMIPAQATGGVPLPFGSIGGPLQVPNSVFMGNFNQITDPTLQGIFQSGVNATGMPYNSWLARQQLINPMAGGWHFGIPLQ